MEGSPLDIKFSKRLPTNFVSNMVYLFFNIIIGLLLVPFFLDTLGTAAYGMIPLATSITGYITLVIDSLNTSISRFLTIDLQHSDIKRANETFNTALFGTLGVIILIIPFTLAVAWYAPSFFNTGDQSSMDVFLLFVMIFASTLIRAWSSNFMVVLFAYNRLDLQNYVNIVNLFMQIILIISLFYIFSPSLILVGISYTGAAVIAFLIAFILSKKICPVLKVSPLSIKKARLREIGGMSTWVLINGIGLLLNTQVALFIVNKLFGSVAGTEYSLAVAWSTLLIGMAGLVTNLFTPMTFSLYAKQDRKGIIHFTSVTIKCVGLFLALPIALVCVFSPQILTIWVGAEFSHLAPLVWISVAPVILQIMVSCISPITVAYNRVRSLVVLTLPFGFLNVLLALVLPSVLNNGMYGVAIAGLITLILRYGIVNPLFIAKIVHLPILTYFKKMAYGIGGLMALLISGIVLTSIITIYTIPILIFVCFSISIPYMLIITIFVLKPDERKLVFSSLPPLLQRWIPSWMI